MSAQHTPGPWVLGEYDEHMGYDCMTGGVRAGPVVLDGFDYGQRTCADIEPVALERMIADAHLIAAAPDLLKAARRAVLALAHICESSSEDAKLYGEAYSMVSAAIDKATGSAQ
jgi:hypothetical protein